MRSVTDIQTGARLVGRNSNITLTDATGLLSLNRIYRAMVLQLPWPEYTQTFDHITTVEGQKVYNWPDEPEMADIRSVEIQDGDDANKFKMVYPLTDNWRWSGFDADQPISIPAMYSRYWGSGSMKFEMRPAPKFGAKTIRIIGVVEPEELLDSEARTGFILKSADDALVNLIAAFWTRHDGSEAWGDRIASQAVDIIRKIFGHAHVSAETIRGLI